MGTKTGQKKRGQGPNTDRRETGHTRRNGTKTRQDTPKQTTRDKRTRDNKTALWRRNFALQNFPRNLPAHTAYTLRILRRHHRKFIFAPKGI